MKNLGKILLVMTAGYDKSKCIYNSKGQMTIFIALIFQVLFVFFAMIINVGLIVHDKINLQNSVDLAAYYGAQRQAEILNAIAHHNYQIRQAWKLLSFRIRVLGDLGYQGHPLQSASDNNVADIPAFSSYGSAGAHVPYVCAGHGLWGDAQDLCYNSNINIPQIPDATIIPGVQLFLPFNILMANQIESLRGSTGKDCKSVSIRNFEVATRWALAYRVQVAYAKKSLRTYAEKLSAQNNNFVDIRGESAAAGALKTLVANLTQPNRDGMGSDPVFRFYNSLGSGDYKQWLYEVPTYPLIFYAKLRGSSTTACQTVGNGPIMINGLGQSNSPADDYQIPQEYQIARNEPNPGDLMASTYGYEKNPWMMAYVGVYAESKPRKPYLPFGKPITIKAKAFAKPFGGRVGPWYYAKWPRSSPKSAGNSDEKIDKLAPEAVDSNQVGRLSNAVRETLVPNYSRYPGDTMGLKSKAALTVFKEKIYERKNQGKTLNVADYSATPQNSDGLAYGSRESQRNDTSLSHLGYRAPWVREIEAAAIAPDLFDATYYSIDRDAYSNYIQQGIGASFVTNQEASYDQGSLLANSQIKTIADQIELLNQLVPVNNPKRFFYIKDPNHLLTGWAPSGAFEYQFPEEVFGKCDKVANEAVPGKCGQGGRVGYSVKIISEDYLKSSNLELGGAGQRGPLINSPPEDF